MKEKFVAEFGKLLYKHNVCDVIRMRYVNNTTLGEETVNVFNSKGETIIIDVDNLSMAELAAVVMNRISIEWEK